jgi:hypothetical protein
MAIQVKTSAKGNAPNTGAPGPTPAPDEVSQVRSPTRAGYGMNGYAGPSSLNPSKAQMSPLAANLKASIDDDGALDRVIRDGTARVDSEITSQLRDIADKNVPDAHSMTSARSRQPTYPGPKESVPLKIGATNAPPVRKP